ncbi:anthranilate phosphoribosyltransferase [Pseudomonas aeruginosa]|uniref:anthranilate phosphoribosyltransferase n=1 Tax=Pseudomonas aeruginosa TaxID=287 RepID=UPI00053F28E5|nr:anthranilate phosphoribosyltransferase [Pseudomonas aeruginosa]EKU7803957.1 anthranilate phosphoribosyltransferase [Pseudomonas aeruginosa]EKV3148766.1 anthranilate phosphoribosyltransferase [Pseudomonas aeruginosa]EKV6516989.1 anthranilate phosphoribosyltransferase [Pseudomonas aeruginosa]EKW5130376.1 anthranilate phosphoribosyltransferase [Pseudomonas aeruginosa]EKX1998011.1 anthranilate phosphoribosyltransferase [Pseudomonas aeruginosa]
MDIKGALNRIVNQLDLTTEEMQAVMRQIMTGQCTDAQIGAFLMGMRMKSETIDEIVGAVAVMRELADGVQLPTLKHVVDVVGTGGDGANIFNVSSAASFVVAAAGGKVAKHGNRAVSGKSGSADLLEAAGIYLELTSEQVARCIDTVGVGFMFAQVHHKAMKYAAGPRRELGLRTLFNMLGPLTNPAGVRHQVVGVFTQELCKPLAEVLKRLDSEHVLVVHSRDGLDEFSLAAATHIAELKDGEVREYEVRPEDFGIKSQTLMGLEVDSPQASLELIRDALGRRKTEAGQKAAELIVMNAGPALYAADLATSLHEGIQLAHDALHTGLAREKMDELVAFTAVYREENAQ